LGVAKLLLFGSNPPAKPNPNFFFSFFGHWG
jgi:hypothetical protein